MKPVVKSALWAAVITTVSGAVLLLGTQSTLLSRAPWLAWASVPSMLGYVLAMTLSLGPTIEGIPSPTSLAVHVLTFLVWWGIVHLVLAGWSRWPARSR